MMQPVTTLYAQYTDQNYGNGKMLEVQDLEEAVQIALELNAPRFKTCEVTSVELDGEILKGEPKNHSANIYVGIDEILSLDDVINAHETEIANLESNENLRDAQMTQHFAIQAHESVVFRMKTKDPSTKFIPEVGRSPDFIELKEDDMVFDKNGGQLYPIYDGGTVPIHTPGETPAP